MHPEQERFYCYGATSRQKSNFVKEGFLNVKFSPKRAIGENTLAKYFKEGDQSDLNNIRKMHIYNPVEKPNSTIMHGLL